MNIFSRGKGNIVYQLSRTWCNFTTFSSYFRILFSRNKFAFLLNRFFEVAKTSTISSNATSCKSFRECCLVTRREKNSEPDRTICSIIFLNKSTEEIFYGETWKNDLNISKSLLKTITGYG